jgi:hypothetical protein
MDRRIDLRKCLVLGRNWELDSNLQTKIKVYKRTRNKDTTDSYSQSEKRWFTVHAPRVFFLKAMELLLLPDGVD